MLPRRLTTIVPLGLALGLALPELPAAQCQVQKLLASDGHRQAIFGTSVRTDSPGMPNPGAAYVFERRPQGWIRTAELVPSDAAAGDTFGDGVAVSGSTIVVGKSRDSNYRSAAYVFEKTPQGWVQTAKLTASDGGPGDNFGWSVDLDGDRALVAAVTDGPAGSAYVFDRGPTGWVQRLKLLPPDTSTLRDFGYAVCLQGDTPFVAAPRVVGPSPPGA